VKIVRLLSLNGCPLWDLALFHDYAAGNTVARIARRIAHQIVGLGVDHECGAAACKHRIRAIAESYAIIDHGNLGLAALYGEIRHVAVVGLGVHRVVDAVVLAFRIEMAASGRKSRRFAFGGRVNVEGMFAVRQPHQAGGNLHALTAGSVGELCGPHSLPHGVLQGHGHRLIGGVKRDAEQAHRG